MRTRSQASDVEGPLDLFIANAGTSHPKETQGAGNARDWQAMMMVNAIAPYQLGRALLPTSSRGGKMIAISSGMGSIGDNGGGWVPYRTSKAALNMAWSSLALEARSRGVACVLLQPRLGQDATWAGPAPRSRPRKASATCAR